MPPSTPAETIERAMTAIRRSQSRRALAKLAGEDDPSLVEIVDAAAALGVGATVGALAEALDYDAPRASRLVTRAVDQGLLERYADAGDGRRRRIRVTEPGRRRLRRARDFRTERFNSAMASWTPGEREQFAALLTRFVTDYTGASSTSPGGH